MVNEMKAHLNEKIIPFWKSLRDEKYGGYYGYMNYDLQLNKQAVKGCILNSRILWFFSNAYMVLGDKSLLDEAKHAFLFLKDHCVDLERGGVYWSFSYDGNPEDTTKHTYNQAFAIYALSSYYNASKEEEALAIALNLFELIEDKCFDQYGYKEALDINFNKAENDKLSENGVMAEHTMNTLLHVFEAYTELYRVTKHLQVKEKLCYILDMIADKIYNKELHRQEVFFDHQMNSLIDIQSYGHDIETAWLVDRGLEVIGDSAYTEKLSKITKALEAHVYEAAYNGESFSNESCEGVVDTTRIWWVQAEAVVGFMNAYQKNPSETKYLAAAKNIWAFIQEYVVDKRNGSEWYAAVDENGKPLEGMPIVEPWKCPYHNGRMCLEIIRRG